MRSIESSLDVIATALSVIAASSGNPGAEGFADATGKGNPPEGKAGSTRGRPPGSPNKPKAVEPAPSTAPAAEPEADTNTTPEAIPDVSAVSAAVTATIKAGFRTEVLETLANYKAKNASGVPAGERAAFLSELAALTDAAG